MHRNFDSVHKIFDLILAPFMKLGAFWGLCVLAFFLGILLLLVFRSVSNQEAIRRVKAGLQAALLELYLYRDDFALSLDTMGDLLRCNLNYLLLALKPALMIGIPAVLLFVQLAARYENRPLKPGEAALIELTVSDSHSQESGSVFLVPGEGFAVETPGLSMPADQRMLWRIRGEAEGIWQLRFVCGRDSLTQPLHVGTDTPVLATDSFDNNGLKSLLNPGVFPLEEQGFVSRVHIAYPRKKLLSPVGRIHWIFCFVLCSFLGGIIAKYILKVEI